MIRFSHTPTLSLEHLKQVLDAIRAARSIGVTPLKNFVVVEQFMMDPAIIDGIAAVDYVLNRWLNDEIVEVLHRHRAYYHLPPPLLETSLDQALDNLALDFRQESIELEAWSMLFFRYVRVDLALSWQQMRKVTLQDERTLRRRQTRGLQRLTNVVIEHEWEARCQTHQDWLHRSIPPLPSYPLVARDTLFDRAWHRLTTGERRHLAFTGPGGIGKTALASNLAHRLIDTTDLDAIAWLKPGPDTMLEVLVAQSLVSFGIQSKNDDTLRKYCQMRNVLIVLDEAETLLEDAEMLDKFLDQVVEAHLILTSRLTPQGLDCLVIEVPELSERDAVAVMQRSWPVARSLNPVGQRSIWEQAGGNPLALEVATQLTAWSPQSALRTAMPLEQFPAQIEQLYERAWEKLDSKTRRFWLATWLLPDSHIFHDLAELVSGLDASEATQAAQKLNRLSMLNLLPAGDSYIIHSVARAYLYQKAKTSQEIDAWLSEALNRLSGVISDVPYAAQLGYRLLELAEVLSLSLSDCVQLIQAVWHNIVQQGMWAIWRPMLEKHLLSAQLSGDSAASAILQRLLGITCRWLGLTAKAEMHLRTSIQLNKEVADDHGQASTLIELAVVYRYQQRFREAQQAAHHALELFHRLGEQNAQGRCTLELAQLSLDQHQPESALVQLTDAPRGARSAALACNAHLVLGNLRKALAFAKKALTLSTNDSPNQARAQATVGRVYLSMGRLADAEDSFSLALSLFERGHDMIGWTRTASALARVYHVQNKNDSALSLLQNSVTQQRLIDDQLGLFISLRTMLTVYLTLVEDALAIGDKARVLELTELARELDTEVSDLAGKTLSESNEEWSWYAD